MLSEKKVSHSLEIIVYKNDSNDRFISSLFKIQGNFRTIEKIWEETVFNKCAKENFKYMFQNFIHIYI